MFLKRIVISLFFMCFLNGCMQNAALIGPAYTLATTGSSFQAAFTYSSNEIITKTTGKSAFQNFKKAITPKKSDTDFQKLVKKNIEETRKKLNLSN